MSWKEYENEDQATAYNLYRPAPPPHLVDLILDYMEIKLKSPFSCAVDVGCGCGQSTYPLASHFKRVLGCDASEVQLKHATRRRADNVHYMISEAESLPLPSSSVQLVTAANCFHWLNAERFFEEAHRVLVDNGVLAVYASMNIYPYTGDTNVDQQLRDLTDQLLFEDLKPYRHPNVYTALNQYSSVYFPFSDVIRLDKIVQTYEAPASVACGYVKSMSTFRNFYDADPKGARSLLQNYSAKLMALIEASEAEETSLKYLREYFLILCRKSTGVSLEI